MRVGLGIVALSLLAACDRQGEARATSRTEAGAKVAAAGAREPGPATATGKPAVLADGTAAPEQPAEAPPPEAPGDDRPDEPPPEVDSPCKIDRYNMSRIDGCSACHSLMDPVGFGLENYDQQGRFRTTDNGLPECVIEGSGEIDGQSFQGPAGLATLLAEEGLLDTCIVYQSYQFAMGHPVADDDQRYVDDLVTAFADGGYRFDELVLDLVGDEAFLYRREEEG